VLEELHKKCQQVNNYHDRRAYGYKRSGILNGLVGIGLVMDGNKSW
jgi:hypothetical protein